MIKNNVYYEFFASYMVPNSNEVGYWIDLGANSKGKVIKVYNPDIKSWVKLTDATSEDAVAPFIGSNGNWWIDNRDTGIPASGKSPIIGENGNWWIFDPALNEYADTGATAYGKTAYEYAVDHGYTGTEEDFGKMLNEVPNAVKDAKHPIWGEKDAEFGKEVKIGFRLRVVEGESDTLFEVIQKHKLQADWKPGIETASLYKIVEAEHAGTLDDPIPYVQGMAFEKDKYYEQYGVIYLCILTTVTGYPNDLKDLPTIVQEVKQ